MAVPGHGGEEAPANGSAVTPPWLQAAGVIFHLQHSVNSLGTGPKFAAFFPAFATLGLLELCSVCTAFGGFQQRLVLWEALGIPDGWEPSFPGLWR